MQLKGRCYIFNEVPVCWQENSPTNDFRFKRKIRELESSEAAVAAMTVTEVVTTSNQALAEALEALSALGYSDREIKRITKQLEALGETTTDVYLSNALKFMMKR